VFERLAGYRTGGGPPLVNAIPAGMESDSDMEAEIEQWHIDVSAQFPID
jgi:hypothetical protein